MELERQRRGPPSEGLVRAERACGEARRPRRDVEGVAVPVQHRGAVEMRKRPCLALGRERDRCPADLLDAHGGDARVEGRCHELGAEADAEHRAPGGKTSLDQRDLAREERIGVGLIGADRPAQDHQQVGRRRVGPGEVLHGGIEIGDVMAAPGEQRAQQAQVLERDMAQRQHLGHHGPPADGAEAARLTPRRARRGRRPTFSRGCRARAPRAGTGARSRRPRPPAPSPRCRALRRAASHRWWP